MLDALLVEAVREATTEPFLALVAIKLILTRHSAVNVGQQRNQLFGLSGLVHGDSVQGQEGTDRLHLALAK